MKVTASVAAFVAVLLGLLRMLARGRGLVRYVGLLGYGLFGTNPIGERIRTHAPTEGVNQKCDEDCRNDALSFLCHGLNYIAN